MHRTPYALAALATQAIKGLDVKQVAPLEEAVDGFDSALVIDSEARHWIVRSPLTASAGAALESEISFLSELTPYVDRGDLPFVIPRVAGTASLPDSGRALVHPELPGYPIPMERLQPGPGLAAALGRALAAIHELPVGIVESTGQPTYSAEEYRERRLAEVDEAAATGLVPVSLLKRWEQRLENVAMWRFIPAVTHGALSAESILVQAGNVSAVRDWSDVKVADPADDLAWVLAAAPADCIDSIMEAYQLRRTELTDPYLSERAFLASELALLRWLLHGTRHGLNDVVADAVEMLTDLDVATAAAEGDIVRFPTYGGTEPRLADDVATSAFGIASAADAVSGEVSLVTQDDLDAGSEDEDYQDKPLPDDTEGIVFERDSVATERIESVAEIEPVTDSANSDDDLAQDERSGS